MEEVDLTVIGAGVVGLAVASELANESRSLYILEKNDGFGQETSSRNSEVIHAGIYYSKDSLKAKTCVEGNFLLYNICKRNNIPHKKTGKLIVATDSEIAKIEELKKKGEENGARGLRLLSKNDIKKIEPNISAAGALFSSTTGVIDSHSLMLYFLQKAKSKGGDIVYNSEVIGLEKKSGGYEVTVADNKEECFSFISRIVINCAGLNSDKIAELVGIDIKKKRYNLKFCRGDYFSVGYGKSRFLSHQIYPVPKGEAGLGIHATIDVGGRLRLGPDDYYIERKLNYSINDRKKEDFYESVRGFLPFIEIDDLSPDMSGIRPKLQGPGEDYRDFVIKDEEDFPGFINLIGIESPGLTSSPTIARHVKKIVNKYK